MAVIPGSPFDDPLDGTPDADDITGLAGNDTLHGFSGNDILYGGIGDDSLNSGDGDDLMNGGAGDDWLINEGGDDSAYGGAGNDRLVMGDLVYGSGGRAYGGADDDIILFTDVAGGLAHGGDGLDTVGIVWADATTAGNVQIDLSAAAPFATSTGGLSLTLAQVEQLFAILGRGNDTVLGGAYDDTIHTGGGLDQVHGMGGDDIISYDIGDASTLTGGDGTDTLIVTESRATPVYFIVDGTTGTADDGQLSQISGFEAYDVRGSSANDIVATGTGNDAIYAGLGDDTLIGREGDDLLHGSRGADQLFGGDGTDRLIGGGHADSIDGGAGNDTIVSAAGSDTLTGGDGADRFVFSYGEDGFDLITDFASGEDLIRYVGAHLGVLAPGPGRLDADQLRAEVAIGTHAQFITRYMADDDQTWLLYFDQGTNTSGAYALMRLEGAVTLAASDISIF